MADLRKGPDVSVAFSNQLSDIELIYYIRFDGRGVFREGFSRLEEGLSIRYYTSVTSFSEDFAAEINAALGASASHDTNDAHAPTDGAFPVRDIPHDYKEKKKLANRIVKAVKGPLEDALRMESELFQRPFEKELRRLDGLLEKSVHSRRDSICGTQPANDEAEMTRQKTLTNGAGSNDHEDGTVGATEMEIDPDSTQAAQQLLSAEEPKQNNKESPSSKNKSKRQQPTPESVLATNGVNGYDHRPSIRGGSGLRQAGNLAQLSEPPTPPMSSGGDSQPLSHGGIPWYMEPFDPVGTTIEEERWTGRELVRGMSEDLSDMDEEELSGLVDVDDIDTGQDPANGVSEQQAADAAEKKRKAAKRRRWRGFR